MLMMLFFILLILWLIGFAFIPIAGGLIHIVLIIAVICLVLHFVRGSS